MAEAICKLAKKWLQRYCVQYEKPWGEGCMISGVCFGGSGNLSRKAAAKQMEGYLSQGCITRLHEVTIKKGVTTIHYPAIEERRP